VQANSIRPGHTKRRWPTCLRMVKPASDGEAPGESSRRALRGERRWRARTDQPSRDATEGVSADPVGRRWGITWGRAAEVDAALRIRKPRGGAWHPRKTRIVHIPQGFEFLGYKIKRGQRKLHLPASKLRSGVDSGRRYAYPREKSFQGPGGAGDEAEDAFGHRSADRGA
jgi:hypothetical protein